MGLITRDARAREAVIIHRANTRGRFQTLQDENTLAAKVKSVRSTVQNMGRIETIHGENRLDGRRKTIAAAN